MLLLFLVLTLARLQLIETVEQEEVPSFKIVINKKGIKKIEDVLTAKIREFENHLTGSEAVEIPDMVSDNYKITNLHMSELKWDSPKVRIVPGSGLQLKQRILAVVEGDYKVKAIFFWIDGRVDVTTSFTLEVTAGVEKQGVGKLAIASKNCSLEFDTFDLDLHNVLLSTVAKLMKGSITEIVEKSICAKVQKSFSDFNIMDHFPCETGDETEKDEILPTVVFKENRIEVYARLRKDTNWDPMPRLPNINERQICLILSKKLIKNSSGKQEIDENKLLKQARKFLPVLSLKNVQSNDMEGFFGICSDLDIDDLMNKPKILLMK